MIPHRSLPTPARSGLAAAAALCALAAPSHGQQSAPLAPSDPAPGHGFGLAVDVHGDTAIVGAPNDVAAAPGAGAAYVFVRSGTTWTQQAKLTAGDAAAEDHFGEAVAVHGDHVVVGAPFADLPLGVDTGVAYVFVRSGTAWTQTAKLWSLFGNDDDRFGLAVDVEGDRVVVGSPFGDGNDIVSGAVYVYERSGTTWPNTARLLSLNSTVGDRIGESVSLSGDSVATGAIGDAVVGPFAGAAYVFAFDGQQWSEQARLQAHDAVPGQTYGRDVALHGDRLVVGTSGDVDAGSLAGAAYVYERQGAVWSFAQKVVGATTTAGDQFGFRVALDGDLLAVGSFGDDGAGANSGSVTALRLVAGTWLEQVELFTPTAASGDQLGRAVAVAGNVVLGGAPFHDGLAPNGGTATAWVLPSATASTYCTAKTNSAGCVPFLSTSGVARVSGTASFHIVGNDVVPAEAGFLVYGSKKANLSFHGGKLCVKLPLQRTPLKQPKNPGGGCSGWVLRRDFNATIRSGLDPILTAGHVVSAQYRQRDTADPTGFGDGLTDAVRFSILP